MNGIYLDTVKRTDAIIEFKNTYPLIDDFDKWMDSCCIIRMIISLDRSGKIIRSLYEVLYLWSLLK